jgi:tetratricopeptide (TPR) repeat protein
MKKSLYIIPFLTLLYAGHPAYAQVPDKPVAEMVGDSLGNVTDAFQEKFFEALKQKAIENYDRAIDALVQALAFNPEEPVVYLELGKNYNALQKYSQAAVYLEKGRKAAPGNEAILEELYTTYYENKEFDRALPVVQELAKLNVSFSEDLVNLYIQNEQFDAALSLLDSLDRTKGSSTYRESLRRQVYARTNNVEAQISDLKENIGENPQDEKDYLNLIFVYSESGQEDKAFETARQLLEINPDSELVHLALYKFYMTGNEAGQAVNSMEVLLGSDQIDEITKYQALNDFLIYVTENPSLEEDLIRLVKVFSEKENNQKVYKQLGTFFMEKGNREVALDYFNTALENEKNDFGLFREVINLEAEAGNYDKVKLLSERALEIFPTQAWLFLMLGTSQNASGNFKEAENNLLMGLDYLIEDPELERNFFQQLAESYKGLNEPQKASEALKKAQNIKQ